MEHQSDKRKARHASCDQVEVGDIYVTSLKTNVYAERTVRIQRYALFHKCKEDACIEMHHCIFAPHFVRPALRIPLFLVYSGIRRCSRKSIVHAVYVKDDGTVSFSLWSSLLTQPCIAQLEAFQQAETFL